MTIADSPLMTTEELLALPDDGIERELIRGQLREREMTRRNRKHSRTTGAITRLLGDWIAKQPLPHGEVLAGEAGFRLRRSPDTTVGIDIAYITPQMSAANPPEEALIEGPPLLAVEILSPSDKQEDILDKVADYLDCGVKLLWVVEPVFRTVSVYRPDAKPALFNDTQEISGDPHLTGFRAPVREFFDI